MDQLCDVEKGMFRIVFATKGWLLLRCVSLWKRSRWPEYPSCDGLSDDEVYREHQSKRSVEKAHRLYWRRRSNRLCHGSLEAARRISEMWATKNVRLAILGSVVGSKQLGTEGWTALKNLKLWIVHTSGGRYSRCCGIARRSNLAVVTSLGSAGT